MIKKRLNLIQQFSLLSLLVIGLIALSGGYIISYYLTKDFIYRHGLHMTQMLQAQVKEHRVFDIFNLPELRRDPEKLEHTVIPLRHIPDVVRVKVWDREGTIIWADEPGLIGKAFPENRELKEALRGTTQVELKEMKKEEQLYERGRFPSLIEVYVPIFSEEGRQVIGAVEVYNDPAFLFERVRQGKKIVWTGSLLAGLLLYLSLFGIVKRAYSTQLRLEEELEGYASGLEQKVAERTRELNALYEVSRAVVSPLSLEGVLNIALEKAMEVMEVEVGWIYLLEPDGETMTLRVHRGLSDEFVQAVLKIRLGEGISGKAAQTKRPVSMHVEDYPTERLASIVVKEGLQVLASTPLISEGKVLGAINLGTHQPRTFPRERLELLASIGEIIGVAVENVSLFEEVERGKEEWEKTFDSISDLISISDTDYRILRVNMAMANRLGKEPGELIGKKCFEVYHGTAFPWPGCPHPQVLETRAPAMKELESEILTGTFMVSISPIFFEDGRCIGTVHVLKDITEKKRLEEETRKRRRLEEISRIRSEFIAHVSHELRTPLNAIIGFSELLFDGKAGELSEKQSRYVGNVLESGRHLLNIINDIIDISKVDTGKIELKPEEFLLQEALEASLAIIKPWAEGKGLTLRLDFDPRLRLIKADPVRFKQVMYNLLSNAVKFTPEGGQVRVAAHLVHGPVASELVSDEDVADELRRYYKNFVQISVYDTGIGIRPEDISRLFKEFSQIDSSYAKKYQGTGLGLALTKRLVELHGGRIWVESEGEGRGTTFIFVLPLSPK